MKCSVYSGLFLLIGLFIFSCSSNEGKEDSSPKPPESKTIKGIVQSVEMGKDGYTAKVQTETDGVQSALVSISNMGGMEHYKSTKVGDRVTFEGTTYMVGQEQFLKVDKIINIENTRTTLLISENSFRGIKTGDKISDHTEYAVKGTLKNGGGAFEVYYIKDFNNNDAGYLSPDPKNELLVGNITVLSKMAETAEGIKIGSTFGDLQKTFPKLEVHGSEIEGHTTARANNLSYRLDVANNTYEVDLKKVPATAKVTQIMINR